jgi:hypothetical protein
MASQFSLQPYNSVSYVDVVALQLGLQRLPSEPADTFLDRLYQAANNVRDHSLQGTIDQIAFELGLSVSPGMVISSQDPTVVIQVSFGQVTILQGTTKTVIPLLTITSDNFWSWLNLSDIVAAINAQTFCTAVLSGADGPTWQLPSQTSLNIAVAESATSVQNQLAHAGVVVGSERFNVAVPSYTLTAAGELVFVTNPPANTEITYVYNISPFQLAVSQVGTFSFMDPALATYAAGPSGALVYQLSEYVQDLLTQDPCYWGE